MSAWTVHAQTVSQSSQPLTSLVIPDIRHYSLHSALWFRAPTGQWIPNEPVEIQLGVHCQKETWSVPHPALSSIESHFKKVHKSQLLSSKAANRCALNLRPGQNIKPWSLHTEMWQQRDLTFPRWAAWMAQQPADASELHSSNIAFIPPHLQTHLQTADHLFTVDPPPCTDAQEHRGKYWRLHTQAHFALKWVQLTNRGEGGAVMQRQGPHTGLHVHCLGIITSNSSAQWFWQAQG